MNGWEDLAAIGAVTRAIDDLRAFREAETDPDIRGAFDDAYDHLYALNSLLRQRIRSQAKVLPIGERDS